MLQSGQAFITSFPLIYGWIIFKFIQIFKDDLFYLRRIWNFSSGLILFDSRCEVLKRFGDPSCCRSWAFVVSSFVDLASCSGVSRWTAVLNSTDFPLAEVGDISVSSHVLTPVELSSIGRQLPWAIFCMLGFMPLCFYISAFGPFYVFGPLFNNHRWQKNLSLPIVT